MCPESISSLNDLRSFKSECYPEVRDLIQALEQALSHTDSPDNRSHPCVAFVGRYSTGKSFLINALVGKEVVAATSGQESRCIVRVVDGEDLTREIRAGEEVEVSAQEFDSLTSFRGQPPQDGESDSGAPPRFFERATRAAVLESVCLLDTPGLDGRESGASVDAEFGVKMAAELSAACFVVLPHRGFGALEQSCVDKASKLCPNISLILNMSDELDEEQVEDVRIRAKQALLDQGLVGRVFVVSALWQSSDAKQRDRIVKRRARQGFEPEEPIHEWAALRSFLNEVARDEYLKNGQRQLDAIEDVLQHAQMVQEIYCQTMQAEYMLPSAASALRRKMAPPLGEAYLDLGLKAAKSGKPMPWALLKNVGISPEGLAPQMLLSHGLLSEIQRKYSSLVTKMCREAGRKLDQRLLRLVRMHLDNLEVCELTVTRDELEFAAWQSDTTAAEFTYDDSLASLTKRWKADPALIETQVGHCVEPLREFVAVRSASSALNQ